MNTFFPSARSFRRLMCLVLTVVMAVSPSASVLAQTNAAQQAVRQRLEGLGQSEPVEGGREAPRRAAPAQAVRTTPATGVDATYVPPNASAVVVIRPAQIMSSPITEMLPREVATAAGLKYLGFDPATVDEVVAFGDLANPMMPGYGLTIKFNTPFKGSAIPPETRAHAQRGELNGKVYLQSQHPMMPSFYGPNNRTLVLAPDETLRQLVEAKGQSPGGPILDRVRQAAAGSDLYAAIDIVSLRPMIGMSVGMAAAQLPPDFRQFLMIPNLISTLELTVNLTGPGPTSLVAHANDDAAAEQVLSIINDANQKYQANLKAQLAEQAASEDPIERAFAEYAERVSGQWMAPFMPTREGSTLTLFHSEGLDESQRKMVVAGIGIAAASLLPAIQASRMAARRAHSANNMKQIMLAWHNYHDTRKGFPAHANYSDDGQPLLSWRVHILPFIEEQALYQQFNLNEPWDSEHNKALIAQMPQVYANPDLKLEAGKTNYLAIVGQECATDGTQTGMHLKNVTDGTSKTIAFVEADPAQAVEWTKPDDLEFNAADPKAGLGNVRPGGWQAAFCDGSVQFIADAIDPQLIAALFTRAGGEPADLNAAAPIPFGPPPPRPAGGPDLVPVEPLER